LAWIVARISRLAVHFALVLVLVKFGLTIQTQPHRLLSLRQCNVHRWRTHSRSHDQRFQDPARLGSTLRPYRPLRFRLV
jgi:hypothetical protein